MAGIDWYCARLWLITANVLPAESVFTPQPGGMEANFSAIWGFFTNDKWSALCDLERRQLWNKHQQYMKLLELGKSVGREQCTAQQLTIIQQLTTQIWPIVMSLWCQWQTKHVYNHLTDMYCVHRTLAQDARLYDADTTTCSEQQAASLCLGWWCLEPIQVCPCCAPAQNRLIQPRPQPGAESGPLPAACQAGCCLRQRGRPGKDKGGYILHRLVRHHEPLLSDDSEAHKIQMSRAVFILRHINSRLLWQCCSFALTLLTGDWAGVLPLPNAAEEMFPGFMLSCPTEGAAATGQAACPGLVCAASCYWDLRDRDPVTLALPGRRIPWLHRRRCL